MNRSEILAIHKQLCTEAHDLLEDKIKNYSGSGDAFTNFNRVSQLQICSAETGILARMADKFGRIITHVNSSGGLVGDETFLDSVHDLINYLVFLYCITTEYSIDKPEPTGATKYPDLIYGSLLDRDDGETEGA